MSARIRCLATATAIAIADAIAIATAFIPAASAQLAESGFETRPAVFLGEVLPPSIISSGNHRVLDEVTVEGNTLEFSIESDYGSYKVESISMVALRVREIRTLAQAIDHFNRDNEPLAAELRGQLTIGADSFVDILTSPLQTTGQLAGQFADNVGQTFEELGRFPDPKAKGKPRGARAGIYESLVPSDPIVASHKRAVANQLGLDRFSSNPRVQEFLDTLAKARATGNRSAGVMTVSLPRGEGPVASGGRIETTVRNEVARKTITELYRRNEMRLLAMDVPEELVHQFLGHPALSPQHKTSITEHLVFLDGVRNRRALVETAVQSRDEKDALTYTRLAAALAVLHESATPITELKSGGRVVLAESSSGALVTLLPFDVVYWTPEAEETFGGLARFARDGGYGERIVVLNGVFTPPARERMKRLGFTLQERFLLVR